MFKIYNFLFFWWLLASNNSARWDLLLPLHHCGSFNFLLLTINGMNVIMTWRLWKYVNCGFLPILCKFYNFFSLLFVWLSMYTDMHISFSVNHIHLSLSDYLYERSSDETLMETWHLCYSCKSDRDGPQKSLRWQVQIIVWFLLSGFRCPFGVVGGLTSWNLLWLWISHELENKSPGSTTSSWREKGHSRTFSFLE